MSVDARGVRRVAVVTGGGGAIGGAIVTRLARDHDEIEARNEGPRPPVLT